MCIKSFTLVDPNTTGVVTAFKAFSIGPCDWFQLSEGLYSPHALTGPYPLNTWVHTDDYFPGWKPFSWQTLALPEGAPLGFMAFTDIFDAQLSYKATDMTVIRIEMFGVIARGFTYNNHPIIIANEMRIPR